MIKNSGESSHRPTALITGASSGLGAAFARVFAQHGYDLILVARDKERLANLAAELQHNFGIQVILMVKDLSLETSPTEIHAELQARGVVLEVLVNNAGLIGYGKFHETDIRRELEMIRVNLLALTLLTKLFLPGMVARGRGRILNLGSTGSFVASPLNAVYSATKAYVLSFSEAIAEELDGTGVTVTALCPGAVRTELQTRGGMQDVRLLQRGVLQAGEVAEQGYRALMAGRRVLVPGLGNQLQIFMARFLPRRLVVKGAEAMLQRTR